MYLYIYVYISKRYYAIIDILNSMHMELDLDINHYDLESLVGLFKIPMQFGETDLKSAKKTCTKDQKVIKVPNTNVFKIVAPILITRGISRIISNDRLIAL